MSRTTIVVPCFNESQRLNPLEFLRFAHRHDSIRILFVNDGSTDDTTDVLARLCSQAPQQLRHLDLPQNGGKAEAVRQGIKAALAMRADFVGYWDADLATPLADILRFEQTLIARPELQVVLGSRIPLLGRSVERDPWRGWLGRIFARAATIPLGFRLYDTQCGAKLFRGSAALQQVVSSPFMTRWIFDVELLARLTTLLDDSPRRWLFEHPLENWHDVAGSRLRAKDFAKAPWELLQICWKHRVRKQSWDSGATVHTLPVHGNTSNLPPTRRAA